MGPSVLIELLNFRAALVIPYIGDSIRFDIADDIIVVIAAEADIAVAINLQGHVDANALIITEGRCMVVVVSVDILCSIEFRHHHGRDIAVASCKSAPFPQIYRG